MVLKRVVLLCVLPFEGIRVEGENPSVAMNTDRNSAVEKRVDFMMMMMMICYIYCMEMDEGMNNSVPGITCSIVQLQAVVVDERDVSVSCFFWWWCCESSSVA